MKLGHELLPGVLEVHTWPVVQDVPVVRTLSIGAFDPYLSFKRVNFGESLAKRFQALLSQCPLDVNPRVRLPLLKHFGRDCLNTFLT
jgi:hypothetical protein